MPIISIVGRPNVGKSSLFNRIIGKRIAVVDDIPGVTRDRNYFTASWNGHDFTLIDTGGLVPNLKEAIPEAIHEQVSVAIKESDIVLFIVDGKTGPTDLDLLIAKPLRKEAVGKVIMVANKTESKDSIYELDTFRSLGIGEPFAISALHGSGVADLLDMVDKMIQKSNPAAQDENAAHLKLAIVGRPNAGKSSLVNKLLNQNRMIVDNVPGTTRDSIDSEMLFDGKKVIVIDTAGLRKRSHVKEDLEYYSNLRAMDSIHRCDVCVLMIDVISGMGVQDLRILRKIMEMHKGVMLAWNKWDLKEKTHKTFDELVVEGRRQYMELRWVPMISISALSGQRVTSVVEKALEIKERMRYKVPPSEFENHIFDWVRIHPHPAIPHKPVRILGGKQIDAPFPIFRFFVTNPKQVAASYVRYLNNKIYETYDFEGCPLLLEFRPIAKPKKGTSSNG